jgi:hypothetical protein
MEIGRRLRSSKNHNNSLTKLIYLLCNSRGGVRV